jgi:multiple sugar transport system substrate-binding protein
LTTTVRVAVREFEPFQRAIARQFADFVRVSGTDARLDVVPMALNTMHEVLFERRELAGGRWDLAFVSTDWIAEAQDRGLVADLRAFEEREPISDFPGAWSSSLTRLQRFAGGVWGVPYHDGPECLIYRKDLLAKAGLSVPRTWEEFHAAARRLHAPERGLYGTVLALFPDGHNSFYDFCIHVWTRGGEPFDEGARPMLSTQAARAALDFLRELARDERAVAPGLRELDSVKTGLLFCAGKVALMTNWFGFATLGDTWAESRVAGKVDVAPIPAGPGGRSVSLNVYWLLAMAAGSPSQDLVWRFLRHLGSAAMDRITTVEGAIGVRLSTWDDPEINRAIPYYHKLEDLHRRARQLPLHPRLSEVSHVVDRMITRAVTSDTSSEALLDEAQAHIEGIVRRE